MDAGSVIKQHRTAVNMSQEDVALALGVTFGSVSQWENGRTHPRRATALKLDQLLSAKGEVAAALGYVRPEIPSSQDDGEAEMVAAIADLRARMASLRAELEAEIADLRAQLALRDQPASPPARRGRATTEASR